jgi:AAA ATPase domain
MQSRRDLVGRTSELDALWQSVELATQGRGALWFVCGEAGIGKSRLVEELVKTVPKEARVLWGRCWEAGGAPAFWPWIQLLRDLLDADRLARMFDGTPEAEPLARIYAQGFLLEAGLPEVALPAIQPEEAETALRLRDPSALPGLARIAIAERDATLGQRVYDRLAEQADQVVTGGLLGMTWDGPRRWFMALLADLLGRGEDAERLFVEAAAQARSLEGEAAWACVAADRVDMQARRGGGDLRWIGEVLEVAERLALNPVIDRLRRHLNAGGGSADEVSARAASVGRDIPASLSWSLRNEGDYWTVCCGEATFRLRDVKGLQMLATLVDSPGRPFHVLDLAYPHREVADADGGTLIDGEARTDYEQRVRALREDLADAEVMNDLGRAARAREELGFLQQHLAEAIGLGGRHRKAKDSAERARVNVQRRLRDAIRRIEAQHKKLGQHLVLHVRTGTYCHYE